MPIDSAWWASYIIKIKYVKRANDPTRKAIMATDKADDINAAAMPSELEGE